MPTPPLHLERYCANLLRIARLGPGVGVLHPQRLALEQEQDRLWALLSEQEQEQAWQYGEDLDSLAREQGVHK